MGFETQVSFPSIPAVHAKPDVSHVNPDGKGRRESNEQHARKDEEKDDTPHPVPNAQGQITGKLIDITA